MSERIQIIIVEPCEIIKEGLYRIIKSANGLIDPSRFSNLEELKYCSKKNKISLVVLDESLLLNREQLLPKLKKEFPVARWMIIRNSLINSFNNTGFDEIIYINESSDSINGKFEKLLYQNLSNTHSAKILLSDRELDVLKLIVKGNTNNQIADTLFISVHTVNSHRKNIFKNWV